jgi:hypothetical protein
MAGIVGVAAVALLVAGFALGGPAERFGIVAIILAAIGVVAVGVDLRQGNVGRGLFWYAAIMPGIVMLFAKTYQSTEVMIGGANVAPDFTTAVYFSVVTWTTLGYGDISPTVDGRLWAGCEAFIGLIYMGVLVSIIVAAITPRQC